MPFTPAEVFSEFFAELERRNIPAVVLHSYTTFPDNIDSDVDFAVPAADLARVPALAAVVAARHGWLLAQALWHETTACYAVLVDPENPASFLKLDACSHYARDERVWIWDRELLDGRRPMHGFHVPQPGIEFTYLLAKMLAKSKPPEAAIPRLRELWEAAPDAAEARFRKHFGEENLAFWFASPAEKWSALRPRLRATVALQQRLARRLRRILAPTGIQVALLGPDGAGKSTLIENVRALLAPCFRRQRTAHFRPMCIAPRGGGIVVTEPHAHAPRGGVASAAKVFLYFFDHWLGWLLHTRPALTRSTLVIFDRHFDDLIVDPRRYRLAGVDWLVRALRRILPRPELTLVLDAEPATVHARKPELPVTELSRQRAALLALAATDPRAVVISAERPPEEVARDAARAVVRWLAHRTRDHEALPHGRD